MSERIYFLTLPELQDAFRAAAEAGKGIHSHSDPETGEYWLEVLPKPQKEERDARDDTQRKG